MDAFESVRNNAESLHDELIAKGINAYQTMALVQAAASQLGLELIWVEKNDPVLKGARAIFDEQSGLICCADTADVALKVCLVAHEIGHARVHACTSECHAQDMDPTRSTEAAPVGLQRVEDYGARERRELQADIFAREFLLPRKVARELHLAGQSAHAIAALFSLPKNLVRQQLFDALLLPPANYEEPKANARKSNSSQDRAAKHRDSPYLLEAGPGTGKTSTLIQRVLSLLQDNVDPASILVLTYSNRAAGELLERLTIAVPDVAAKIWIGTFHAFGLDLIRRYHDQLGLPTDPPLFDRSDAIEVFEEILPTLPLVHYRNLWDPAMELREIVNAISRAKDELIDAKTYHSLALAMQEAAVDEKDRNDAEKALEIASIYKLYEEALQSRRAIDFGDLIMRPALFLENDEGARITIRLRHRHVLVDEYQDVNRASARLLKAIADDGKRLWVVGDARQSIYRFRGASSINMTRFKTDYANSVVDMLDINYRSSTEIVDAFKAIAPHMGASSVMLPLALTANAGSSGIKPELRTLETLDDEVAGIAASVRELETMGIALRDQVILCRTNSRLNDIAFGLEMRGIPVLHLGSLFERDEIRDLLALLSLLVDPFSGGLARVGAMSRYNIPLQDIYIATRFLQEDSGNIASKLAKICSNSALSLDGKRGLKQLADDLADIRSDVSAWEFLAIYLLDRTNYLAALAQRNSIRDSMQAVAIWQFLNFVRGAGIPIYKILNRIRNLVLLSEERDLRQIPPSALHMNAVRLMTVHGSKGLEFKAVHLPGLTVSSFPSSPRGQRCPPPKGLVAGTSNLSGKEVEKAAHAEEEQCLFFVAMSRAQLHLRLYNSRKTSDGKNRTASSYLDWLGPAHLVQISDIKMMPLPQEALRPKSITITWRPDWKLTHRRLGSYEKCPRRFFYTHALGLRGAKKATAFNQTHNCLYEFIDWLAAEQLNGAVDRATALEKLQNIWLDKGPTEHAFAKDYHLLACGIAEALLKSSKDRQFCAVEELPITLPGGSITVIPDGISRHADGKVTLRRVRTGAKRSDEYDKLEYTLFHLAAQARYGTAYAIEALHLSDDIAESVTITAAKMGNRKAITANLVTGIAAGEFPPDPNPVTCPRCPHFFICGDTGKGSLKQI